MRNIVVRRLVNVSKNISKRVNYKVLRWLGRVKCMGVERKIKKNYELELESRRAMGWPCSWFLDGNKEACNTWTLELRDTKVYCRDEKQLTDFVDSTKDCLKYE